MKNKCKYIIKKITKLFLIILVTIVIYQLYINLQTQVSEADATTSKNNKDSNNNSITDTLENSFNSVVGVSKLKDNGTSVFLMNASQDLGLGTGIIVSKNGYILTNEHVSGSSSCYVTLSNGNVSKAKTIWSDDNLDLSIVKVNEKFNVSANLGDSNNIKIGESVYAIGNPIGYEFQRTVTSGIISGKDRKIKLEEKGHEVYMEDLIQTDATINPGNSGGPLINNSGEVIGINTVKITSAEGIGFAIPINIIKPIIKSYEETGNFEEKYALKINNFKINFGKGVSKFEIYDTIETENKLKIFSDFYLPISVIKITNKEVEEIQKNYQIDEAKNIGIQELEEKLDSEIENKESIVSKNINTYEKEDGVDIYVTYEVLENIGTNEKIVF